MPNPIWQYHLHCLPAFHPTLTPFLFQSILLRRLHFGFFADFLVRSSLSSFHPLTQCPRNALYNALIRTHHITSRKKVASLKRAADTHNCFVLLRSGGCPGIMYVEGQEQGHVEGWVGVVKRLRYKDFQLVRKPGELVPEGELLEGRGTQIGLNEVESVKEFGSLMAQRGVWGWWRKGMGYS